MKAIMDRINQQPVAIMFVVSQAISVGVAFGLNWSTDQVVMVNGLVAAILSVIVWHKVSPI